MPRLPHRCTRLFTAASRLGAAGTSFAVVIALVPGLHVQLGAQRAPGPGRVRDLSLRLDAGARIGRLQAQALAPDGTLRAPQGHTGAWVSEVLATGKARLLGVSWKRQADGTWSAPGAAEIWYRTATAKATPSGQGWTQWERAEPDDAKPEPGSHDDKPGATASSASRSGWPTAWPPPRSGSSSPALPPGTVDDLTAHLVEPDMAPTPDTAPAGAAVAAPVKPFIISRARWGADEHIRGSISYGKPVQMGFLHHTVQSNSYTRAQTAGLVRADYLYHVKTRGWSDVGYNFLVDRSVLGAHTGGFNNGSFGVALIGDFTKAAVPGPAVASLKKLFAWKLDVHHVDPARDHGDAQRRSGQRAL